MSTTTPLLPPELTSLRQAAKITGASQEGYTVCIHSYVDGKGYDHPFRINKEIGAYLVALLHWAEVLHWAEEERKKVVTFPTKEEDNTKKRQE